MNPVNAASSDGDDRNVTIMLPMVIGVGKLRQQYEWLLSHSCEESEGLIGIVNAIQDHLVDVIQIPENDVFPVQLDSEDI